ncbi:hypothetical protein BC832DRAFT_128453 [Gaertneriomyces semiglobifer]|nr:hypothetical protein BC832DRAFT_128453 [Gaertneriomyces semiglobifer]
MTVEQEDAQIGAEYTGNFEADYYDACKRYGCEPFKVVKLGPTLPPLPTASGSRPTSATTDGTPASARLQAEQPELESYPSTAILVTDPASVTDVTGAKNESPYSLQPTLFIQISDPDDTGEEDLYKIEIRGWKIPIAMMEAFGTILPATNSLTHLRLWNCHLEEPHFAHLATIVTSTNLRILDIDQNQSIPDSAYGFLLSEEASLKSLSLRSNNITDNGSKSLATALKTNRTLCILNLWDNNIGKEGAEALAEALKVNQTLMSLSLGANQIGDEGAAALAKALSNELILLEELTSRKKALAELDKQRREQEELPQDQNAKKGKPRLNASGRNTSAREESIVGMKPVDAKGRRPPRGGKKEDLLSAKASGPSAGGRKGGSGANGAADEKPGVTKGKDKKGVTIAKGGKKAKPEESKDEGDETSDSPTGLDSMFEYNGQWFALGNRTLNSLNLFRNGIHEDGVRSLFEAVQEQEATTEHAPDGSLGLFRLPLQVNPHVAFTLRGCALFTTRAPGEPL